LPQSFGALGVSAQVAETLASRGINSPFAVQTLVLPHGLAGTDVLVASPTGSGKTLAFGIPLVELTPKAQGAQRVGEPRALVLVPTRELASQVVSELRPLAAARGLRIEAVYGGTSVGLQARQARGAEILVATPGRLSDLIDRRLVSLAAVRILVLDEADRMLDMGFKPQVDRLLAGVPAKRQTMLFSATLEGPVTELARTYTVDAIRIRAEARDEVAPGEIEHAFHPVTTDGKLASLAQQLESDRGLALVFVRTKHGADKLARKLHRDHGVASVVMHGDMSQNARERSLARFEAGHVSTLIATDVAARGLDIDDITHVINFDPPRTDEDYVHRVGRTGRAGRSGRGSTFVLPEQRKDVGRLADRLGHGAAFVASVPVDATITAPRPGGRSRSRRRGR